MRGLILVTVSLSLVSFAADAQAPKTPYTRIPPTYIPPTMMSQAQAFDVYKAQMITVRDDALKQQAADGGALTPEHREAFQRRIDEIETLYHHRLAVAPPN